MIDTMKKLAEGIRKLHNDEQGADMVEYILMIAAVALPLLAVVIWFWKDISMWAYQLYQSARGAGDTDPSTLTHS